MSDDLIPRLDATRTAYQELRPRIEARDPWPLAEAFGVEPEASWGPREVLAHCAEMLPFWHGEYERVQAGAGTGAVPFGRIASDALRIGVLERDRTLPLRELFARIDAGIERWRVRLAEASNEPATHTAMGAHPRLGELTANAIVERFVVAHLEEHAVQLREIVDRPAG